MMRPRHALTGVLGVALLIAGCVAAPPDDGRITVLAAFYPLQYVAQQVGGERVSVQSLTPAGAEPHDVELSPRQVAAISEADLVLYLKGFQPAVDQAVEQEAGDRAVDVSAGIPPLAADDTVTLEQGAPPQRADEHGSDPHVWLDPANMVTIGDTVAARLRALDPGSTATYRANLRRLDNDMAALDREWRRGTRTCRSRDLVVSHDAFGYLAQRYGFRQVGINGLSPEAEPSPATLATVTDFVRANGIATIYFETLVDPAIAQTVADETGARTSVLDPIESVPTGSDATYPSLMLDNLRAVREGQPCR